MAGEELTEEQVLLVVVQLFLQWIGGPGRLPRPSEVLFCSRRGRGFLPPVDGIKIEVYEWHW